MMGLGLFHVFHGFLFYLLWASCLCMSMHLIFSYNNIYSSTRWWRDIRLSWCHITCSWCIFSYWSWTAWFNVLFSSYITATLCHQLCIYYRNIVCGDKYSWVPRRPRWPVGDPQKIYVSKVIALWLLYYSNYINCRVGTPRSVMS